MLTENANQLTGRIAELKALRQQAVLAEQYRTRVTQLSVPVQALNAHASTLKRFQKHGLQAELPAKRVAQLRTELKDLTAAYLANPDSVVHQDGGRKERFWEPLKELPGQVQGALKQSWTDHVQQTLLTGRPELLEVLRRLPGFAAQVELINQLRKEAQALAGALPGPNGFAELDRRALELRRAWEQLPTGEISPEILDFLKAASQGRATLLHVTAPVVEWLKRYNLLSALKVTL